MINLKELSLVSGKAAWMAYLDVYCLDAYGSLDAAIAYENISSNLDRTDSPKPNSKPDPKLVPNLDAMEKSKLGRKQNKRSKESEGWFPDSRSFTGYSIQTIYPGGSGRGSRHTL